MLILYHYFTNTNADIAI